MSSDGHQLDHVEGTRFQVRNVVPQQNCVGKTHRAHAANYSHCPCLTPSGKPDKQAKVLDPEIYSLSA